MQLHLVKQSYWKVHNTPPLCIMKLHRKNIAITLWNVFLVLENCFIL
jgi:hypothetical protein